MTPARRIALLAAVVVIAVVAFIALRPDEGSKEQTRTPSENATTTTTGTGTSGADTTERPDEPPSPPPIANVTIRNGKPVGGVQKLEFGKGQKVQFVVTSDVADHVHVHGYDIMKDVEPGKPTKFSFEGDIDGKFEVELEDRAEPIIDLVVTP
jgi:heme/copper-type cytochrome/quinol oxidase subunit 2